MNHVTQSLTAYHDGELEPRAARYVEAHIAICAACHAELAALEALSSLLQVPAPIRSETTPEQFAAEVALQLPRRERHSLPEHALVLGWRLAPVLIIVSWVFLQSVGVVVDGLLALIGLGIGDEVLGSLLPVTGGGGQPAYVTALLSILGLETVAGALTNVGSLAWAAQLALAVPWFTLITALAIASWLATWLVLERRQDNLSRTKAQ